MLGDAKRNWFHTANKHETIIKMHAFMDFRPSTLQPRHRPRSLATAARNGTHTPQVLKEECKPLLKRRMRLLLGKLRRAVA